jgi:predicted kinase
VIVDATFHRGDERGAFLAGLGARPEPVLFVVCRASEEALLARADARRLEPGRVSDADAAVVARQLAEFEPLGEIARQERAELVTEAAPRELVTELEALVDARVWRRPADQAEA